MSYNPTKLSRQQKEAVSLLSIGTFLEYFDLMLYVHMSVLLNELFFPQSDPLIAPLLTAFTFCSTFLFRPIGGFIIGWIGDQIGRKSTIILTTSLMAIICATMASIGTYEEIGLTATIVVIVCRMLQGFSSLGEVVGAQLFATETLKQPQRYVVAGIIEISARAGGLFSLIVALFAISINFNWRIAFWIGAIIAIVGFVARMKLRETPEFVDFNRRMKIKAETNKQNHNIVEHLDIYKKKADKKIVFAYFLTHIAGSVCFYIAYIYVGNFMKKSLGMSAEEVIFQNLKISIFTIIATVISVFIFVKRYHPLKIASVQLAFFGLFLPFVPYWLNHISNLYSLSCLQFVLFFLVLNPFCAEVPCFKHIPIARRFTILATTFGVATAFANVTVSFGIIHVTKYFEHYGLWVILVPVTMGMSYAIYYATKLEKKSGRYFNYPDEDNLEYPDSGSHDSEQKYTFDEKEAYSAYDTNCRYSHDLLGIASNQALLQNKKLNIWLIEKAIIFAKKWHDGQLRDTGEPYYSHPLAVASIVAEYYCKTDVIIAAILHDVVEDSDCAIELIEKEFNRRIAEIVYKLTRIRVVDDKILKLRLEEIIKELKNDPEALLIKQVDRLHNLHTIGTKSEEKQIKSAIESNDYLVTSSAYTADKLNISDKFTLEDRIFQYCSDILLKYRR